MLQKQLNELRHGDIGFDHERTIRCGIVVENGNEDEKEAFLHYLRQQPEIETVFNGEPLYPRGPFTTYIINKRDEPDMNRQEASVVGYFDWEGEVSRFHNLRLLQGRLLQPGDSPTDVVINESTAKLFDWDTPIDKTFMNGFRIIGVVKDFQNNGPTLPAQPSMLMGGFMSASSSLSLSLSSSASVGAYGKRLLPARRMRFAKGKGLVNELTS